MLVALLSMLALIGNVPTSAMDLVFASVVWRHGDRSYWGTYPNDPYKDKGIWKNGFGQLTNIGIKQQHELGRFLRSRYDKILHKEYLRDEIYVRSTDIDRAIMSAESNMAGMYPPTEEEQWNGTHTIWHPIPVHTVPESDDGLLRYPIGDCPNYDKLQLKIRQSPWYIEHEKNNSQFYDFITKQTGVLTKIDLTNVGRIEDNLFCLSCNNYTLPSWASPKVMNKLRKLHSLVMGLEFTDVEYKFRDAISQMQGGVLLKEILQNMVDHIGGNSNRSIIAYSAHDTTLTALLVAMGNYNWVQPAYANCIMTELYEDGDRHFVKIFYRNSTKNAPVSLKFYGCDVLCPLDTFQSIARRVVPEDRAEVCGSSSGKKSISWYMWLAALVSVVILVFVSVLLCTLERRKKHYYRRIPMDFKPPL